MDIHGVEYPRLDTYVHRMRRQIAPGMSMSQEAVDEVCARLHVALMRVVREACSDARSPPELDEGDLREGVRHSVRGSLGESATRQTEDAVVRYAAYMDA